MLDQRLDISSDIQYETFSRYLTRGNGVYYCFTGWFISIVHTLVELRLFRESFILAQY